MHGLHFSNDTIQWWNKQTSEAKAPFTSITGRDVPITTALNNLKTFINDIRAISTSRKILIWCQGTDFDAAILKTAYYTVLHSDTPWQHTELRDSRTFIHGIAGLLRPDVDNPYTIIPKNPKWKPHDALSDVDQLIWNVTNIYQLFIHHSYNNIKTIKTL